jgi:hypothetical protein
MRLPAPPIQLGLMLGAVALLLLASCGEEAAEQPAPGAPAVETAAEAAAAAPTDACALLPAAEVQGIVGGTVGDSLALALPGPDGGLSLSQCNYSMGADPAAVSLMLRRGNPGETPEAATAGARQSLVESGVEVEDVPGLGQTAFWGGNQLHVFADEGWYLVVTPPAAGGLEQARELAERSLEGL